MTMNLTVPLFVLAGLTVVYKKLLIVIDDFKEQNTWEVIKILNINCTNKDFVDQTIQLMARFEIPVTVSSNLENHMHPDALQIILSDDFAADVVKVNSTFPRILMLHSTSELNLSRPELRGRLFIILLKTQKVFCRNPLFAGMWVAPEIPKCLSLTHRNTNPRRISVFVQTDMQNKAERQPSGIYVLTGLKGLILYEMKRYLNVKLSFVLRNVEPRNHTTPRKWQTFIRPIRGVPLGRINDTLIINNSKP